MPDPITAPPLLDEHGASLGEVPSFVGPDTLEKWLVCAIIATEMTGTPAGHAENSVLASYLFQNGKLDADELDFVIGEFGLESKALEESILDARARAVIVKHQWRGRGGKWIDMPDAPRTRLRRPPPPQSPGVLYTQEQIRAAGLDKWPEKGPKSMEVLGDAKDTTALYALDDGAHSPGTGPRMVPYSAERTKVHDAIIAAFKKGKRPPKGAPHAVFTAGGPASGKTTMLDANPDLLPPPENTIEVNADKIKELLDEYQEIRAAGDHYAANAVHRESGDIAARLLLEALKEGYHVVVDGTGNGEPGEFASVLTMAHEKGYAVDVLYVNAPTDVAIGYAIQRAEETGRYVPVPAIQRQHALVSVNFVDEVAQLEWLDALDIYDQGDHVASWSNGALQIVDRKKFVAFVQKQEERRREERTDPRGQARA